MRNPKQIHKTSFNFRFFIVLAIFFPFTRCSDSYEDNSVRKSSCVYVKKLPKNIYSIYYESEPVSKKSDGYSSPALVLDGILAVEKSVVSYRHKDADSTFVLFDFDQEEQKFYPRKLETQLFTDGVGLKRINYYSVLRSKYYSRTLNKWIYVFEFSSLEFSCKVFQFTVTPNFEVLVVAKLQGVFVDHQILTITKRFCGDSIFYRPYFGKLDFEEGVCE